MGIRKKGGRPKGSTYALTMMYTRIIHYQKRYKLTSWNAWKKFTESKHFLPLIKHYYKRYKNSDYYINRMLENETNIEGNNPQKDFYRKNIKRRGKDKIINYLFTKKEDYTHRKKR